MDSALKIGDDGCLTAASKAVVPSFWFLETGIPDKSYMKLSYLPWEEGKDPANHSITYSAFLPTDQQGMQTTDSETDRNLLVPWKAAASGFAGTTNRPQWSNLIKAAHRGQQTRNPSSAPVPFLVSIQLPSIHASEIHNHFIC